MIKSVGNDPVYKLLSSEDTVIYQVPKYQREYAWSRQQWDELFDDLLEEEDPSSGHFLGTIICINRTSNTTKENVLELVDGQQRMTTLSILMAAIYKFLNDHIDQLDADEQTELSNLRRQLILKDPIRLRVRPQIQNSNYDDYLHVLKSSGLDVKAPPVKFLGNRRIMKAYNHFSSRIEKQAGAKLSVKPILDLLKRVKWAILVKLEVESTSDAFTLFESLNNRGMQLTPIDIIKNSLLAAADKRRHSSFTADHVFDQWNELLSDLGDDYQTQERFFRHYYNAFKDELPAVSKAPIATRSNLIRIYEKLISTDVENRLADIIYCGGVYRRIIGNLDAEQQKNDLDEAFADLARVQGAPSEALLLYLMTYRNDLQLNDKQLTAITETLTSFFVRRNLTGDPATNALQRLFMSIIGEASGMTGQAIVDSVRRRLRKVASNDTTFYAKLVGPLYNENAVVTRYILVALARESMTTETFTDLWEREGKHFKWTIEHILPQGPGLPKEWIAMLGGADVATAFQQQHVHRLGNLTITGYNSTLGNRSFHFKKNRKDSKGNFVGFKNLLPLNDDVVQATEWTATEIEARTEKLAKRVLELFPL
ncbi:DUF262 domain-containing protein [Mycolicibacterium vanbaalenii]|uniref:DUF262 domain-containing protein n=1 Tax=Mycolicibacterium vanbaalenii TaxID=110539 RepID=UPI001F4081AF|nr:DUF262 domain-containing protein [Mycolicibacterium vanbaalenii]UJL30968.1 DUF262 domain-containing protein [Mycolicibacterium vanbaalenii]WND57791.1 DUF262 domain-containing protein [Mycolicibacterium vanbaalenii]